MLQKLNERIQGIIAWVVIILIAITFTLFGLDYFMQSQQASSTAETIVNGQPISKQAFETNYRRIRQQRDLSQMTANSELALKKKVLNDLIANEVSVQAAKRAGFAVNREQADAAILSIPQFQQDGHFSRERYQQALSGAMFTPESFQNEVKQGMLLNQQRFAFIGSSFVLPHELERFVKLYMQTRDYQYLEIPISLFVKNNQASDAEVAQYYREHRKEFLTPEQLSIDYLRLSTQALKNKIQVSPEEIKRYYEDNQSSFLTPAQWQVAHILFAVPKDASEESRNQIKQKAQEISKALVKNPSEFEKFVKTKSDDKLSLASGGLLPWLTAGQSGFDKELANMTQPGQISKPIQSENGYEIFKLIAHKPATTKTFAEVEANIKEQLVSELTQTQYTQALEKLGDLSYQSPDSLNPVAEALNLTIEQTKPFSRQGGEEEITKNKQVVNAAFSHDVLELGNNSEPIQLDNDSVLVLRVNKHVPATEKTFAEVKDFIAQKLTAIKAEQQAKLVGQEFLSTADSNPTKLLKTYNLQWKEISKASRDLDKVDATINELAFGLARANSWDGRPLQNGNFAIVHLQKINDGQYKSLDKEQQASLAQQIEANYGVMDYDLYLNQLVNHAKIEKP